MQVFSYLPALLYCEVSSCPRCSKSETMSHERPRWRCYRLTGYLNCSATITLRTSGRASLSLNLSPLICFDSLEKVPITDFLSSAFTFLKPGQRQHSRRSQQSVLLKQPRSLMLIDSTSVSGT